MGYLGNIVCLCCAILLFGLLNAAEGSFETQFYVSWAPDHVQVLNNGQELRLTLDRSSGSGFASKNKYLFGNIDMQIKLVPGDSAGTVTAYYLSSEGPNRDELDFEFLGNKSGQPYVLQTNVYASGKGDREQRIYLWFDPTKDFHTYSVVWNRAQTIFMVDGVPIRVFRNNKAMGVAYPENQKMGVFSSIWNGDNWATQGGVVKIDWSYAPFVVAYRNFQALPVDNQRTDEALSPSVKKQLQWVRANYMIYDYCNDHARYPVPPSECAVNV